MDSQDSPTTTTYKQVTVDVPEDRVAEFHAFFGRFLAGRPGRRHRSRHGHLHRGAHGRRCDGRHGAAEQGPGEQSAGTTEV